MIDAATRGDRAETRAERLQPWIATASSALLHALFLFLLLHASTITLSSPQGASSGGRVKVDFIGQPRQDSPRPPVPPTGTQARSERPKPRKPMRPVTVTSPTQAALVTRNSREFSRVPGLQCLDWHEAEARR